MLIPRLYFSHILVYPSSTPLTKSFAKWPSGLCPHKWRRLSQRRRRIASLVRLREAQTSLWCCRPKPHFIWGGLPPRVEFGVREVPESSSFGRCSAKLPGVFWGGRGPFGSPLNGRSLARLLNIINLGPLGNIVSWCLLRIGLPSQCPLIS
jgi:hypothetical protein